MKKMIDIFNVRRLQKHIDDAIQEIKNNRNLYLNDNDKAQYIAETLISSGYGQTAFKEFCDVFGLKYYKDWMDFNLEIEYFDKVIAKIEKIVELPEDYYLYIGWNENDGAIELYVEENM